MLTTLYTVGHSNHSAETFLALLMLYEIQILVDIRAYPGSKRYPQFDQEALRDLLNQYNIVYHWAGRHFGGKRPANNDSRHIALDEDLRGFADHMDSNEFARACVQLMNLAQTDNTAMMCAERQPYRCHRSLISDYLSLKGLNIVHIMSESESTPHTLNEHARLESTELIYDRNISGQLIN